MNKTFCILIGLLMFWIATISIALAGDWRSEFTTKDGRMNCCGIKDCRPLARGVWIKEGDKFIVFPGERPTELTVIHPSQDGKTWICSTGCGFQSGMS